MAAFPEQLKLKLKPGPGEFTIPLTYINHPTISEGKHDSLEDALANLNIYVTPEHSFFARASNIFDPFDKLKTKNYKDVVKYTKSESLSHWGCSVTTLFGVLLQVVEWQ